MKQQVFMIPREVENNLDDNDYFTRYNGGWSKSVTGLDKTKNNGYSIQGEFMRDAGDNYTIGGIYIDCGIGGSRKNQRRYYALFRVISKNKIEILATSFGENWATDLWEPIERALVIEHNPLGSFTTEELANELKRRNG